MDIEDVLTALSLYAEEAFIGQLLAEASRMPR